MVLDREEIWFETGQILLVLKGLHVRADSFIYNLYCFKLQITPEKKTALSLHIRQALQRSVGRFQVFLLRDLISYPQNKAYGRFLKIETQKW